jgi:hypothetical protein
LKRAGRLYSVLSMTKHSPFRCFKTSPEVIRLTLLLGSTEFYADAAFSTLRAHAAGKPNSQFGLLAAVSRISAIQSNDLAPTNMNGPKLPLAIRCVRRGAVRRRSHSLQRRGRLVSKFTHCGTNLPLVLFALMSA